MPGQARRKPAKGGKPGGDIISKSRRSELMSRIRSRGNRSTELAMIKVFRREGIRGWRRHIPIPTGSPSDGCRPIRPDFVFQGARIAVFVDGCFWHGCPLHSTRPKNNAAFWSAKIEANRHRDAGGRSILRRKGWHVMRIWEHEIGESSLVRRLRRIRLRIERSTLKLRSSRPGPTRSIVVDTMPANSCKPRTG